MSIFIWWIIIGLALIIAEMLTGTLYLIFIGIGFLLTSILAHYNVVFIYQIFFLSIFSIISIYLVHRRNKKFQSDKIDLNNFELGKSVFVQDWHGNNTRVLYKGAYWEAQYVPQINYPSPIAGEYSIIDMQGNLLLIKYKGDTYQI